MTAKDKPRMDIGVMNRNETPVPLSRVAAMHPRGVTVRTVRRWCTRGIQVPSGRYVKLESWKEGGERFTTLEAYARFVEDQNQ